MKLSSLIPLIFIIIFSIFFRFILLDKIPTGLSNDELDYVLNAKAIFLTGSDISGTWNPLSFTTPTSSFSQAEIPPLATFIAIGILPFSLLTSKIIYAFFGIGTVITLYLIAKKLLGEREAFFIGLVASLNPWLIYFGRTAYDAPIAIFTFLLGLYSLLVFKGWRILYSFPFFLIAFYSYIGTKIIYIPFLLISIIYSWYFINKKKFKKQYIILFLLCLIPFFYFTFHTFTSQSSRITEISTPFANSITETINYERKLSIQNPLTNIFSNKLAVFTKVSIEKYLNAFSPKFLFINGDDKLLFTLWTHGVFYYLDLLFLVIGTYALFRRNKNLWIFIMSFILIAPIPSMLSMVGLSYAIRSMLLAPFLIFLIGFGIYYFIFSFKTKLKIFISIILIILYSVQILNFANIYFFRNPIYNSESFNFSARIISKYLSFQEGKEIYVINGNPATPLKYYLFYTNSYNKNDAKEVAKMFITKKYNFNGINFVDCRGTNNIPLNSTIIFESGFKCEATLGYKNYLTIPLLSDGGSIYSIANDKICNKYKLKRYPYGLTLTDMNIEKLNEKDFCQKFITKF